MVERAEGKGFGWLVKNSLRGSAVERGSVQVLHRTGVYNLTTSTSVAHFEPFASWVRHTDRLDNWLVEFKYGTTTGTCSVR